MQSNPEQLVLFDPLKRTAKRKTSSTFVDNMTLPVHRWFRYSAGFSAAWVRSLMLEAQSAGKTRVLDPFAGSGTVLLAAEACGMESVGVEIHPFVSRVARAKLMWREDPGDFLQYARSVLDAAKSLGGKVREYPSLIEKCYPPEALSRLDKLRRAWETSYDGSPMGELTWLALVSILRECSPAGTAPWQYVLPRKSKAKATDPYVGFLSRAHLMAADMGAIRGATSGPPARLYEEDARHCRSVSDGWADIVITSPPYANNFDYADATRLEMTFMGEVARWGDLQEAVRKYLVRSCTQHVSSITRETPEILQDPILAAIRSEIIGVCGALEKVRENRSGRKPYHTMVAAYFSDMARAWQALRRAVRPGGTVCFVVGDSAPYGVYVPVDKWLGELALAAGFRSYRFEKTRDRNVKWECRKHRTPLQEGFLWVSG